MSRTPLVRLAAVVAVVTLASGCAGPTRSTPTPQPSGAVTTLPVGITPTMTTWDTEVDLPGVGKAVFTRVGDDAELHLTASVAGVRLGLGRGARIEGKTAFSCSATIVSGAAPDGAVGAGRTAVVRFPGCATGDSFAWNYMVDDQRTLSIGVEEG